MIFSSFHSHNGNFWVGPLTNMKLNMDSTVRGRHPPGFGDVILSAGDRTARAERENAGTTRAGGAAEHSHTEQHDLREADGRRVARLVQPDRHRCHHLQSDTGTRGQSPFGPFSWQAIGFLSSRRKKKAAHVFCTDDSSGLTHLRLEELHLDEGEAARVDGRAHREARRAVPTHVHTHRSRTRCTQQNASVQNVFSGGVSLFYEPNVSPVNIPPFSQNCTCENENTTQPHRLHNCL